MLLLLQRYIYKSSFLISSMSRDLTLPFELTTPYLENIYSVCSSFSNHAHQKEIRSFTGRSYIESHTLPAALTSCNFFETNESKFIAYCVGLTHDVKEKDEKLGTLFSLELQKISAQEALLIDETTDLMDFKFYLPKRLNSLGVPQLKIESEKGLDEMTRAKVKSKNYARLSASMRGDYQGRFNIPLNEKSYGFATIVKSVDRILNCDFDEHLSEKFQQQLYEQKGVKGSFDHFIKKRIKSFQTQTLRNKIRLFQFSQRDLESILKKSQEGILDINFDNYEDFILHYVEKARYDIESSKNEKFKSQLEPLKDAWSYIPYKRFI